MKGTSPEINKHDTTTLEPVARFLKSSAVFIDYHTGKMDKFFDLVNERNVISEKENELLLKHYEICKNQDGGKAIMQENDNTY
jgi:hypothetical protein